MERTKFFRQSRQSQDQEEINTITSSTDTVCPTETSNSTFIGLRSVTKDKPLVLELHSVQSLTSSTTEYNSVTITPTEIPSIKMDEEEEFNPVHKINKITFNHHLNLPRCFRMLMIGSSGSGKTNLLLRMLLTDNFLDYDNLIIFSKTLNQPEYQYILHGFENNLSKKSIRYIFNNQEKLFNGQSPDGVDEEKSIEEVMEQYALTALLDWESKTGGRPTELCSVKNPENSSINVQFYNNVDQVMPPEQLPKNKKNLIIFDDCINEKNQNIMENYFTRGRHSNTNVIYLSQNWFDLDKRSIRGNSNYIILFKLNKRDKSLLHSDLLSNTINKEEFDDLTKVWNQKYKYLAFNIEGEMKIRDNIFKY